MTITRDEIKALTGREKLRDIVIDEYAKALAMPGIEVHRLDQGTLQVSIAPTRVKSNEFSTLQELKDKNSAALKADPELAASLF